MGHSLNNLLNTLVTEITENRSLTPKNRGLKSIEALKDSVTTKLKKVYKNVLGKDLNLPKIDIFIDNNIKHGKIAGFNHSENGENGVIGVKEKALDDIEYLKWVLTHELIHACIGEDLPESEEHEGLFKKLADGMGLPKEYQD
jgi:hypothetical protein